MRLSTLGVLPGRGRSRTVPLPFGRQRCRVGGVALPWSGCARRTHRATV